MQTGINHHENSISWVWSSEYRFNFGRPCTRLDSSRRSGSGFADLFGKKAENARPSRLSHSLKKGWEKVEPVLRVDSWVAAKLWRLLCGRVPWDRAKVSVKKWAESSGDHAGCQIASPTCWVLTWWRYLPNRGDGFSPVGSDGRLQGMTWQHRSKSGSHHKTWEAWPWFSPRFQLRFNFVVFCCEAKSGLAGQSQQVCVQISTLFQISMVSDGLLEVLRPPVPRFATCMRAFGEVRDRWWNQVTALHVTVCLCFHVRLADGTINWFVPPNR